MDISAARLDSIESQSLTNVPRGQKRQNYSSMNKISNIFHTFCSRVFLEDRGNATLHEPVSEFLTNLEVSDLFNVPGEYVLMDAEMLNKLSDGSEGWLEKLRSHGTPLACLKNDLGDSVLHLASRWNHLKLMKNILSECPCLLLEPNSNDQLPIHVAACSGHLAVVEALVASITFFSARLGEDMLNPYLLKDENGDTALNLAMKGRYMKVALCLVNANRQASFLASKDGISPLYLAVEAGDVSFVKKMLGNDDSEETILNLEGNKYLAHAALKATNTDIIDLILNKYPSVMDVRNEEGKTCISYGASMGDYKGVCKLLDRSTKGVFVCDDDGSYPIHVAIEKGRIDIVKEILKRCPYSKQLLNKKGQNVLHIAADIGRFKILSHFMKCKHISTHLASEKDVDGNTPLHLATIKWRPRAVRCLAGTKNLLIKNNNGLTALDIAESKLQPRYIFLERMTLVALADAYCKKYPECRHKMKVTRPVMPEGGGNKDYVNGLLVVAALIAAVTFAAGFTLPGGAEDKDTRYLGMANLVNHSYFIVFIISDILGFECALLCIITLVMAQLGDPALYRSSVSSAMNSLYWAIFFMSAAFCSAMYIAAGSNGMLVMLMGILIPVGFLMAAAKISPHIYLFGSERQSRSLWHFISLLSSIDDDGKESDELSAYEPVKISKNNEDGKIIETSI